MTMEIPPDWQTISAINTYVKDDQYNVKV